MLRSRVKQLMTERGLRPTELHKMTKTLSLPTVLKWAGEKAQEKADQMDLNTLVEFSRALDVPVTELYEEAE